MQVTADLLVEVLAEVESKIIARYSRKLSMISKRHDIEDVLQNVRLKAFKHMDSCRAEDAEQLGYWVLTIAKYEVESLLTANRACQKRSTMREGCAIGVATDESRDGYQPSAKDVDPSEKAVINEECQAMLKVIERLPEQQAKCLRMKYLEQMEYSEIATALGVTVEAARNAVMRALATAREEMGISLPGADKKAAQPAAPVSVDVADAKLAKQVAKLESAIAAEKAGAPKIGWPQYHLTRVVSLIAAMPADAQPGMIAKVGLDCLVEKVERHLGKKVEFKKQLVR